MIQVRQVQLGETLAVLHRVRVDRALQLEQRIRLGDGERRRDGIAPSAVNVGVVVPFIDAILIFNYKQLILPC
jgi:hypothetical protein